MKDEIKINALQELDYLPISFISFDFTVKENKVENQGSIFFKKYNNRTNKLYVYPKAISRIEL